MSCEHDCPRPPAFPKTISNRPGLDTIAYRIGTYADMRAYLVARLDEETALSLWTHRKPDDPGIALLEGSAIIGDILSYYQQLYANEAFLRTARWRESVSDLVRLLGYRLAPGLGGLARFALTVKGDRPIIVPKGFGFKAQLKSAPKPANFETVEQITAHPGLGLFHLYRPRYTPPISNGTDMFCGASSANAVTLKPGDQILVGTPRADGRSLDHTQLLTVDKSWEAHGIQFIKMKGSIVSFQSQYSGPRATVSAVFATPSFRALSLTTRGANSTKFGAFQPSLLGAGVGFAEAAVSSAGALRAYKVSGSFRHFGHNAPASEIKVDADGHPRNRAVSHIRKLAQTMFAPANPSLASTQMPLDGPATSVVAGTLLVIEGSFSAAEDASSAVKRLIERKITATDRRSLAWGSLSGASTMLTLDGSLALTEGDRQLNYADIRGLTFHQIDGAAFMLQGALQPTPTPSGNALDFYGTAAELAALDKRAILLSGPSSALVEARVVSVEAESASVAQPRALRRITLDRNVDYRNFDHDQPTVDIYGNLVKATEGKTEDEITLGDGDNRQIFQTFPLPKPPLTYLLDTGRDPPQLPQLNVYVDRRLWRQVDTLFDTGARDPVYIVREDPDGKSYIQFGDGKTGARLPSGRGNVVVRFRTGVGSHGVLKADAKPQADRRLPGLDKVFMPEPVVGGAEPETEECARIAAPGRMQSLARLVSLADFEAEALSVVGVLKARAAWSLVDGTACIVVTVLTLSQQAADGNAVADILHSVYRTRGPARCPVTVVQGTRRQLRLTVGAGYDESYRQSDIRTSILEALGTVQDGVEHPRGLFSWQQRNFGESVHGSQIIAAIQNASGVRWVQMTAADTKLRSRIAVAAAARRLGPPAAPARQTILCPESSILALDAADLTLSLTPTDAAEVS